MFNNVFTKSDDPGTSVRDHYDIDEHELLDEILHKKIKDIHLKKFWEECMYTGDVKVKYDEVRLVYSNTIMLFEYENPKFELEIGAGLKLRMEFANDQVKKDPSIDIKIETNTMVMKFINFNNSLGLGSSKPLEIATIEGETILMNYIIHGIGEQKLMHINLYARKVGGKN